MCVRTAAGPGRGHRREVSTVVCGHPGGPVRTLWLPDQMGAAQVPFYFLLCCEQAARAENGPWLAAAPHRKWLVVQRCPGTDQGE